MTIDFFPQISMLLALAVASAFIAKFLRQPIMIAYIVAGIGAGPLLLGLVNREHTLYSSFSELGVILLLFIVGLSLNFNYLKKIGKVALLTGIGQVVFTGFFGMLMLRGLNFSLSTSIFLAIAITFSSTIIITKLLNDKRDTDSVYGRYTIGLMIVQDIVAIIILILLNSFSDTTNTSLVATLGALALKGLLLVSVVYFLSRFVLPKILDSIANSNEFLFLFTLTWCFGITSLVHALGFSLEIGAIAAGLSLSSSPYQLEIGSRIKPLRDFFLIIFFIMLGSQMDFKSLESALVPSVVLSLFILIGNPLILYSLFRLSHFTRRNSLLAGLTAAQVSEFGFVLLFMGQKMGHIGEIELAIFTLVALITIFVSSYLITYNEQIYRALTPLFNLFGKDKYQQPEKSPAVYDIWVVGYHRIGWRICETLKQKKVSFAVIDFNPEVVKSLQAKGIPAYFGDIADLEFLHELPLDKAKYIISTIPTLDDQITLLKHVRGFSKKVYFIANSAQVEHIEPLYATGAHYVMMPHLLGGGWMSELFKSTLTTKSFVKLKADQQKELNFHKTIL